jgi:hypothetical protein
LLCILDYVFGCPGPPKLRSVIRAALQDRYLEAASPAASPEGETSMAKPQQSQGPFTIANLSLQYGDNTLSVLFDATVKLGLIEFALLGFGFSLKFNGGVTLQHLSGITPGVKLSGMALEFNNPPVVIAGIFNNLSNMNQIKYMGGVVLGLELYSFKAVGSYGEIKNEATGHWFKSVFVFCQLEGLLKGAQVVPPCKEYFTHSCSFGYRQVKLGVFFAIQVMAKEGICLIEIPVSIKGLSRFYWGEPHHAPEGQDAAAHMHVLNHQFLYNLTIELLKTTYLHSNIQDSRIWDSL